MLVLLCFIIVSSMTHGCSKVEEEERKQIEIASFTDNPQLTQYIYEFNDQQTEYEVVLNKLELTEESHTKLMIDIVGGNGPDIINWGVSYNKTLVAGDAFLDMTEYMNENLLQEEYAYNILNAFTIEDELKVLVANYRVSSMALLSQNLKEIENFNIDALIEYYDTCEKNMVFFMGETKNQVLAYLLGASVDSFINWEDQSTSFDSKTFQRILEFCNRFPEQLKFDDSISIRTMYLEGNILMYPLILSSEYDITTTKAIFGGKEIEFMGYPAEEQSIMVCEPIENAFSVNSQSEYVEGVYIFLDGIFSYEYQREMKTGYPVFNTALDEKIEDALQIEFDSEGQAIAKAEVRFQGEEAEEIYQIAEVDGDQLKQILTGVTASAFSDSELMQIIFEESDAYFQGEKSVEEVVQIIKNRADLYMREKY